MKWRYPIMFIIVYAAIRLTAFSEQYVFPAFPPSNGHAGRQASAGFPFPVYLDSSAGSPTSGWGRIGPEDYTYSGFLMNVLFYSFVLGLVWIGLRYGYHHVRR